MTKLISSTCNCSCNLLRRVRRLNLPILLKVSVLLLTTLQVFHTVSGHGRLMEPPNRSSIFRFSEFDAYKPEKNWDDNELWCGGLTVQYKENGGKCGPCGDNYKDRRPRQNENGGLYGRGIIVRTYKPGQTIRVDVELTQYHKGHFEFSLCPLANDLELEEEECFEKYPLMLGDGSGFRYRLPKNESGWFNTTVTLPPGLTSPHAVLRWHYRTGNRWDWMDDNHNTGGLGHGDQEIFRGCADVVIGNYKPSTPRPTSPDSDSSSIPTTTRRPVMGPTPTRPTTTRRPATTMTTILPPRPTPGTVEPPSIGTVKPVPPKAPMQHPPKVTLTSRPTTPSTVKTSTTTTARPARPSSASTTRAPRPTPSTTRRPSTTTVLPSASTPTMQPSTTAATSSTSSPNAIGPESARPPPGHPMMRPPAKEAPKNKQNYLNYV